MNRLPYLLCGVIFCAAPLRAVQSGAGFNATAPTSSDIANWNTGWGASGITGWNYVGQVNGDSAVYLGNGWVLTAAHVGAGNFLLDGFTYSLISGSAQPVSPTADWVVFKISTSPGLPNLTLSLNPPNIASGSDPGSAVAMLGYGGDGSNETWGLNFATANNIGGVMVTGYPYVTTDFETAFGTTAFGSTNSAQLVGGDSGGADFSYNTSSGLWELTGINEGVDPSTHDSYMVQISTYEPQLAAIVATPEPSTWALLVLGLGFICFLARQRRAV